MRYGAGDWKDKLGLFFLVQHTLTLPCSSAFAFGGGLGRSVFINGFAILLGSGLWSGLWSRLVGAILCGLVAHGSLSALLDDPKVLGDGARGWAFEMLGWRKSEFV